FCYEKLQRSAPDTSTRPVCVSGHWIGRSQVQCDADDQVAQGAEASAKRPAIVRRQDPSERRSIGPKRIERYSLTVLGQSLLQLRERAPGFHGRGHIPPGMFQDAIQSAGRNYQLAVAWWIAPIHLGGAATRDDS